MTDVILLHENWKTSAADEAFTILALHI